MATRRLTKIKSGSNTTRENVLLDPVEIGRRWYVKEISAIDSTTAFDDLRFFVRSGGTDHFYRQFPTPAADTVYNAGDLNLEVGPGEQLGAAFYGITDADVLRVFVQVVEMIESVNEPG